MEQRPMIAVYRTVADLVQHAAEEIANIIRAAINDRGVCFVVLSGGETPRHIYQRLGMAPLKEQVSWNRVHLFFSDERAVPPTAPQSNYGMVEMSLISWIDIPRENVHRMKGEIDPDAAAEEYTRELRQVFGEHPVRFDLVLLGVGEDGHAASIFPGSEVVEEEHALVLPVSIQGQSVRRVTLTLPCINTAREVVFLASGKQKAHILQRVLGTAKPLKHLPATMVRPVDGAVRWMIDGEAASQIDHAAGSSAA